MCSPLDNAKCFNDGYAHPNNCNTCVCPDGYTGPTCRSNGQYCGRVYDLEMDQTVIINENGEIGHEKCDGKYYYVFNAPNNSHVCYFNKYTKILNFQLTLYFTQFDDKAYPQDGHVCASQYMEIKLNHAKPGSTGLLIK
jgi:hypothetical protein